MTEFRVAGVKAGYHTGESLTTWLVGGGVGVGWGSAEPRASEDVGQTLSTDSCPRYYPVAPAGREAAGRERGGGVSMETERRTLLLGRGNLHYCQLQGSHFLTLTKENTRANIFFSYILTCDFSVPENV